MKRSLKDLFWGGPVVEGIVPQGSAEERPLHGAPVYYFATGRSLPNHLQDRGGMSSARKWNEDGELIDVEDLEDKQDKKKRWYSKETKNESMGVDQKRFYVPVRKSRQANSLDARNGTKLSRTTTTRESNTGRSEQFGFINEITAEKPEDIAGIEQHSPSFVMENFAKGMWNFLKEYYPHDPAINDSGEQSGVEGEFYSMTQEYYHGTNKDFAVGDYILPPAETGEISEKGRKKNLDKVFFTLDKGSAKIYAGRAVQSFGTGSPQVYKVQPIGDVQWVNKQKGTTVLMAPIARVVSKV